MVTFDPSVAHQQAIDDVITALDTDGHRGQNKSEVLRRRQQYGANELTAEAPLPAWPKFLAQFTDALVVLLLIATALSAALWLYERESPLPYEAIAIFSVVLLNAVLGYVQESRAEAAVAAIRAMSAADATVVRDGTRQRVPAVELVPGDLILIEEGDLIPADARLIRSSSPQTADAALTGESLPTQKDVEPVAFETGLGDRSNMIFSGTAATYGHGAAIVTAIGMQTEMGRIAGMLKDTSRETTPLQNELDRVGKMLEAVVVAIASVACQRFLTCLSSVWP